MIQDSFALSPGSPLRLRQVGVVTRDPKPVEDILTEVLGLELAERFPGIDQYGLGTAFFPIGNQFFEVVHSAVTGTSADRLIEKRGGDTGFIVMLETLDLDAVKATAYTLGIQIVDSLENAKGKYLQFHPNDVGGTLLAVYEIAGDDAGAADGAWMYGGDHWKRARRTDVVSGIAEVVIECKTPQLVAQTWLQLAGGELAEAPTGQRLQLTGSTIRFVAGREDRGLTELSLVASDVAQIWERANSVSSAWAKGLCRIGGLDVVFEES